MDFLKDFGVQPILLAAQVVNFLILLFILKRFLYKPILKVLDARKNRIALSLKQAEEIEKRLIELSEEEQKRIAKATEQAEKIVSGANQSRELIKEETKEETAALVQKMLQDGGKQNQVEKQKMRQEIRVEVADLVVLVVEKVTGKKITKEDQKNIIERELKNLT